MQKLALADFAVILQQIVCVDYVLVVGRGDDGAVVLDGGMVVGRVER